MAKVRETIEIEKNVLYGGPETFSYGPVKSLGFLLIELLKGFQDKVVFIDAITDDHVTYKQLLNDSIETAKCLQAAGLKMGDTIGIISENRLEFAVPLLAALYLGVTVAPMNVTYTERELVHAFGLSRPKLIFTSPFSVYNVIVAASETKFVEKVIQFGENLLDDNAILFRDFIKQYKELQPTEFIPTVVNIKEHNALVLCSSGTTGLPKGVQLTHFNVISTLELLKEKLLKREENNDKSFNMLGIVPFFHSMGCLVLLAMTCSGETLIVVPKFEEDLYLSTIEKYKIKVLLTAPPLVLFLAKHPLVDKYDLSSVEEVLCGAAPLSAETADAVEQRLNNKYNKNIKVCQGYGMSETTLGVLGQNVDDHKQGSVGTLAEGTYCKVIDPDTGKILGKNQAGELCFKGSQIMKGYIGNNEATRDTIDKDGWLHTGDIGYYDNDYHFYIVDRLKELIKYKGYQVPPAELEGVLLTNLKIKDAAVVGLPDEACGELPLAFVVRQPNVNLTEKDVISYVEERVSSAKRLRGGVRFIDEIPKNPSGKILRRELRALLAKSKL